MNRLWIALGVYAGIAVLAWFTLGDEKIRTVTLAILAMFAVRTLLYNRRHPESDQSRRDGFQERE